MSCETVIGSIVALLDGELADAERLQVEEHLARCAACAHDLDELRATRRIVTAHLVGIQEQVSGPRFETVWARIAAESAHRSGGARADGVPTGAVVRSLRPRRRWLWAAGASAGLALAAGVAALLLAPRLTELSPAGRGGARPGMPVVAALPAAPESAGKPAKAPTRVAKAAKHAEVASKEEPARRQAVATAPSERTPADAPVEEAVAVNELDPPRDLLERPDLFLNYPIVRKLDELRNLDAVLAGQGTDEQPDDGGAG